MRYWKGDWVRVREGLTRCNSFLTSGMQALCGKVVTIRDAVEHNSDDADDQYRYTIMEDNGVYYWSSDCFEPYVEEPETDISLDGLL